MQSRCARSRKCRTGLSIRLVLATFLWTLQSCSLATFDGHHVDILLVNGVVYDGSLHGPTDVAIGIVGERIVYVGELANKKLVAAKTIDASGLIIAPGFIDPHTHSLRDLLAGDSSHNQNYLMQGVTTVVVGNDGSGVDDIGTTSSKLEQSGIGTNVGFLTGHGQIRRAVMGEENRPPTELERAEMRSLVRQAMQQGALGISSGLYYTPGSFAETSELIDLAGAVAEFGGIYDTHIRDESSYSIGLIAAVREAIEIGGRSGAPVNISHIKALGADVWGQSQTVIDLIEAARDDGIRVTADQYPWNASGTSVKGALVPKLYPGMTASDYPDVLSVLATDDEFVTIVSDNLRRRGGASSILITAAANDSILGRTLSEIAARREITPIEAVFEIESGGGASIASFNMNGDDIERFMSQPWVMTSSDGSAGHPRKYATYPMKYQRFVVGENLLTLDTFIHRSSALVADTFNIRDRGRLEVGAYADITVFDAEQFKPLATYADPTRLSTGVEFLLVNGVIVISDGKYTQALAGRALSRDDCRLSRSCQQSALSN